MERVVLFILIGLMIPIGVIVSSAATQTERVCWGFSRKYFIFCLKQNWQYNLFLLFLGWVMVAIIFIFG